MFIGIVDLGADFVRLSIYKYENTEYRLVLEKQSSSGICYFSQDGVLTQKGMTITTAVLKDFKTILDDFGIRQRYAFASAALRGFSNCAEFLQQFGNSAGLDFNVLSFDDEAKLGFAGALRETGWDSGLFVGIGGTSIDLAVFSDRETSRAARIPYGALNLSLKYVRGITLHKSSILEIKQYLKRELKKTKLFEFDEKNNICASGDAAESALKLYNEIFEINDDNTVVEPERLSNLLAIYNDDRRDFTRRIIQNMPDRIQTVIPGIIILSLIAIMSKTDNIKVCCTGVREEYLYKYIRGENHPDLVTTKG